MRSKTLACLGLAYTRLGKLDEAHNSYAMALTVAVKEHEKDTAQHGLATTAKLIDLVAKATTSHGMCGRGYGTHMLCKANMVC